MELDCMEWFGKKVDKNIRICFLTGMGVGILTHFYMLTNKMTNWDDINSLSGYGAGDNVGRFMLKYLHPLGTNHSIPAVHGMLMLFCLSIMACLIYRILSAKSVMAAVLIPTLLVTFPSVACTMTFMFTVHTYGFALCFLTIGVFLLRKYRFGWIPAGILFIMTLGVYQSYISIAITLLLMSLFIDVLNGCKVRDTFFNGLKYILTLGSSTAVYMILCRIAYPALSKETYGGVGKMGQIAVSEMPILMARCYKRFLEYFITKPFDFVSPVTRVCNTLMLALCILFGILLLVKKKRDLEKGNLLFALLIAFLIPFAMAFIYFMAPEAPFSMLMLYSYSLVGVFTVVLFEQLLVVSKETCFKKAASSKTLFEEKTVQKEKMRGKVLFTGSVLVSALVLVTAYSNYLTTNTAYLRMQLANERVKAYFNRILTNIEATEGFQAGDQVVILGEFHYEENPSSAELPVLITDPLRDMSGIALENGLLTSGVRTRFIETFLGFPMAHLDDCEVEEILNSSCYQNMPVYPKNGSITKIGDVWVCKLCENEPSS